MSVIASGDQAEEWSNTAPTLSTSYHDHIAYIAKEASKFTSKQWATAFLNYIDSLEEGGPTLWDQRIESLTPSTAIDYLKVMVEYMVEKTRNDWIGVILRFISDNGGDINCKWDDVNPEWAKSALEELLEVREQVAAESQLSSVANSESGGKALDSLDEVVEHKVDPGSGISNDLFLFLCRSTINVPIVASDKEDALRKFEDHYGLVVDSVMMEVPEAVDNEVIDRVYRLLPGSMWDGYVPHGDYYGPQNTCDYYTVESQEKRRDDLAKKTERMVSLLEGLNEDDIEVLRSLLLNETEEESIERIP